MPSINFSHKDKVSFSVSGATKFVLASVSKAFKEFACFRYSLLFLVVILINEYFNRFVTSASH